MSPEEQLRLYEQDTNAEKNIRDAITQAYQNLVPETTLVRKYENEQFPAFYSAMSGYGADSGLTNLDPLTILQNAWNEQARMATTAQVARDAFNIRKASMEDLIKSGLSQWQQGYAGAQNAYQRWWEQKQHEDQMALAREQMRRAYARTITPSPNPYQQTPLTPEQEEELRQAYQREINYQNNMARWRQEQPILQREMEARNKDPWVKVGNFLNNLLTKKKK